MKTIYFYVTAFKDRKNAVHLKWMLGEKHGQKEEGI